MILGYEFVTAVEGFWNELDTADGRYEFQELMLFSLREGIKRWKITRRRDSDVRLVVNALGIYCSYLLATIDNDYTAAFELLYKLEQVNRAKFGFTDTDSGKLTFDTGLESAERDRDPGVRGPITEDEVELKLRRVKIGPPRIPRVPQARRRGY